LSASIATARGDGDAASDVPPGPVTPPDRGARDSTGVG